MIPKYWQIWSRTSSRLLAMTTIPDGQPTAKRFDVANMYGSPVKPKVYISLNECPTKICSKAKCSKLKCHKPKSTFDFRKTTFFPRYVRMFWVPQKIPCRRLFLSGKWSQRLPLIAIEYDGVVTYSMIHLTNTVGKFSPLKIDSRKLQSTES